MTTQPASAKPAGLTAQMRAERPEDGAAVDRLIERAFGPGRLVKTAERLRESNRPLLDLSRVAVAGGEVVGCCRMWPVHIGQTPAVLLGPFAVDDAWRSQGLGARLIEASCQAAAEAGHGVVLLVGDEPYFARMGLSMIPRGQVVLPGPVNTRRLLWRGMKADGLDVVQGPVRAG
jgi:predicted N-acetyltransferase YhbS